MSSSRYRRTSSPAKAEIIKTCFAPQTPSRLFFEGCLEHHIMAALEIEGKIRQKLAKQTGQSAKGAWTKQDFVVEYQDGNYPAEVCFTAFGNDKVADLDKYQAGDSVKVAFNLSARESNG